MKLFLVVCLVASVFAAPAQEAINPVAAEVAQNVPLANTNFQAQDAAATKTTVDFSAAEVVSQQVDVAQPVEELKVQAKKAEIAEVPAAVESIQASEEIVQSAEEAKVQVKNVGIGEAPAPVEPAQASEEVIHHAVESEAQESFAAKEEISAPVESVKASEEVVQAAEEAKVEVKQVQIAEVPAPVKSVQASEEADQPDQPFEAQARSLAVEAISASAESVDASGAAAQPSEEKKGYDIYVKTVELPAPVEAVPIDTVEDADTTTVNLAAAEHKLSVEPVLGESRSAFKDYQSKFASAFGAPFEPFSHSSTGSSKSVGSVTSPGAVKASEATETENKPATNVDFQSKFGSQFGSAFNSEANPAVNPSYFTSPFGAPAPNTPGYDVFGYNKYNPGFQSGYNQYTPGSQFGYNKYNPGFQSGYNQYNPGSQFGYNKYNPGFQTGFFSNAGKEPIKPADETKVVAKPAGTEASAEPTKDTETAKTEDKSDSKTPSTDAASTATSSMSPFQSTFGSQFGSVLNSGANPAVNPSYFTSQFGAPAPNTPGYDVFGYDRYNPGSQAGYNQYNPGSQFGYNKYNPGFQSGYNQYNPGSQFGYNKYNPGFQSGFFSNAGKEPTKPADETKVVAKPAGTEASAEPTKATETAKTEDKPATNTPSTDAAPTATSSVSPFQSKFGSQFGSVFNSGANPAVNPSFFATPFGTPTPNTPGYDALGYNRHNPSFQPGYNRYNPGYNQYNPGYNQYNSGSQFGYNKYNPGFQSGFFSNAGKEPTKPADEIKVVAKPAGTEASAEPSKATETAKTEDKPATNTPSTDAASTATSSVSPFQSTFGSQFGSVFNSGANPSSFTGSFGAPASNTPGYNAFGYNKYNPSYQSGHDQFNPSHPFGYNKYNPGFQSTFFSNAGKESVKSGADVASAGLTKTPVSSATIKEKLPAKTLSGVAGTTTVDSSSSVSKTTVEAVAIVEKVPTKTPTSVAAPASDSSSVSSQSQFDEDFVSAVKPGIRSPVSSFVYSSPAATSTFQQEGEFSFESDEEPIKPAQENGFKIKSVETEVSSESAAAEEKEPAQTLTSDAAPAIDSSSESDVSKVAVEISATKEELPAATLPSDSDSSTGSLASPSQPKLGSTFGSAVDSKVPAPVSAPAFASVFDSSPFRHPEFNTFSFTKFNPSFQPGSASASIADEEPVKPADELKVKSGSAVTGASLDAAKPVSESVIAEKKLPAATIPNDSSSSLASSALPKLGTTFGSAVDSEVPARVSAPAFASAFGSSPFRRPEFNTFSFTKFNPTFQPSFPTADKEQVKPADELKVKSESTVTGTSSAIDKPIVKSATVGEKEAAQPLTSDAAPAIDSSSESDVSKVAVEISATKEELPAATLPSDSDSSTGSLASPSQPKLGSTFGSAVDSKVPAPVSAPAFASVFDSSPFRRPEFNTFSFTKFNPSFQPDSASASIADKEPVKPADELKVKVEPAVTGAFSDAAKPASESAVAEKKLPAATLPSDSSSSLASSALPKLGTTFGSAVDSEVPARVSAPAFASAFGSSPFRRPEFNTFSFTKFNPTFQPGFPAADKEQVKPADKLKVKSESTVTGTSSAIDKPIIESATAEEKEPAQPLTSDAATATGSSSESDVSNVAVESSATKEELPAATLPSDSSSSLASSALPKLGSTFGSAVDSKVPAPVSSPAFASVFDSSPFRRPAFNTFSFTKFNPTIVKEPVESAEEAKVKSEPATAGASSGASSGAGSYSGFVAVDSHSRPISPFGSAFETGFRSPAHPSFHANSPYPHNSGFGTFSHGKYNPNYQTGYPYDPSFGNYNGNYKYNDYGKYNGYQGAGYPGFPSTFGGYPGYNQAFKGKTTHSQVSSAVPSPFRTGFPIPQDVAVSSEEKSSSEQSEHKITDTQSVQSQGQFFKNFKSFSVKPTVTSFVEPTVSLNPRLEVAQSPTAA